MLKPLGDSALLIELGDEINPALNQRIHALNGCKSHPRHSRNRSRLFNIINSLRS